MPTYEYLCEACGHDFEIEQRITEPPATTCPKCKKKRIKRLIIGGNFILKGSGWYADGYSGSKPDKKDSASEKSDAKSSETKKESKSEAKPSEKSEKSEKKEKKKASKAD